MGPKSSKPTENTRDRLLEAGIDIFGAYGYEPATTRMIAGEAGVNIAAIPYYFNGKEGLYHAAVTHIVEKIEMQLGATFRHIADLLSHGAGRKGTPGDSLPELSENPPADRNGKSGTSFDLLETLLEKLINFMIGSPEALRYARILLREQLYPTSAYDIILNRVFTPMIESIAGMISHASADPSMYNAKLRATAIFGQVMAFRVARETMIRTMDMEGYSPGETADIRRVVLEHTRAIIASLKHPERADKEE